MVEGFVDAASAYAGILTLARKSPSDSFRMEWDVALAVTATFISANQIKLLPSPRPEGPASGPYGILLKNLGDAVSRITLPGSSTTLALRKTKRWAADNAGKISQMLGSFAASQSDEARWLESNISNVWQEHVLRQRGMFDKDFIPQLAVVLNTSRSELERMWALSADQALVSELVKKRPDSDTFRLVCNAYVASTLLRGRYHNYAARESQVQILSHPIGDAIRLNPRGAEPIKIESSNTERYLASIALAGAFAERDHQSRVATWIENVLALRRARDQVNLDPKDLDETARDVAIDAAKKFGVRVHSRRLETFIDAGVLLGSLPLTCFVLTPWENVAFGVIATGLSTRWKIGQEVARTLATTRWNLKKLSQMVPGHIGYVGGKN